jgi:hypothetical protein
MDGRKHGLRRELCGNTGISGVDVHGDDLAGLNMAVGVGTNPNGGPRTGNDERLYAQTGIWGIPSPNGRYLATFKTDVSANVWMVENP